MPPEFSVIVPHYNDLARLDRCLAALSAQTIARDRYEIVVADNMSPVGEAAVRDAIGDRARLVIATRKGAGPARNVGVAASTAPTLAFTDCDCIPEPDWLEKGIAALTRFDFIGGRMIVLVEGDGRRTGAEAFELVFAFNNESYVRDKGFTVTANLFCPRALFDATGPFRVGLSEDADWCFRATALGYRLGYAADAVVAHPARADWPALRHKWRRLNAEGYQLARQKSGGRLLWMVRSLALPPSIVAHAPRVLRSRALNDSGERMRALGTLARLRMWRFLDANLRGIGLRK